MYAAQSEDVFEQENNNAIDHLQNKVNVIRDISITIGEEVKEHNRMLDNLDEGFDSTAGLLSGTMRRLDNLAKRGGMSPMCTLAIFIMVMFIIIYWIFSK
eukprot:TRINITY_DN5529_c0_g1_i2.p2 TRINITY_DN5529_c0_g1~~TRINITY_DN5529_c0_g1_i2.p2  ORF type:complete len:100 (+),score=27.76 TRINITY_DN5529_c0_g1_i2:283-582(+)